MAPGLPARGAEGEGGSSNGDDTVAAFRNAQTVEDETTETAAVDLRAYNRKPNVTEVEKTRDLHTKYSKTEQETTKECHAKNSETNVTELETTRDFPTTKSKTNVTELESKRDSHAKNSKTNTTENTRDFHAKNSKPNVTENTLDFHVENNKTNVTETPVDFHVKNSETHVTELEKTQDFYSKSSQPNVIETIEDFHSKYSKTNVTETEHEFPHTTVSEEDLGTKEGNNIHLVVNNENIRIHVAKSKTENETNFVSEIIRKSEEDLVKTKESGNKQVDTETYVTQSDINVNSLDNNRERYRHSNEEEDDNTHEQLETETDLLLHSASGVFIRDLENKDGDEDFQNEGLMVEEEMTKAPDGGWGWFIILGALLCRFVIGGLGRSHGLFYIKFLERYGSTSTATALVTSVTGLFRIGFGPLVSILCSRFPCRYLTAIGACLLVTGLILTGFSPSLQFLYFSYGAVCGLGRAFALTPVPILLGYYFDKRRSLAFGLASAGFSLGGFCVTPVVEVLFQTFGFQGTYLLLGGFALNILVCAALFRPIELHRNITRKRCNKRQDSECQELVIVRSIEDVQSGEILSSSTISIEKIKSTKSKNGTSDSAKVHIRNRAVSAKSDQINNGCDSAERENRNRNRAVSAKSDQINHDNSAVHFNNINGDGKTDRDWDSENSVVKGHIRKRSVHLENNDSEESPKEKKPLIAWSILKDFRFLCYCFSNFLLTMPSGLLFLPSLAKARGASDLQAAALLSVNAGVDTVSRVASGFLLDLRIFRKIRPQIFSAVILVQGFLSLMYPLTGSYQTVVVLCAVDGWFSGLKAAQNSVVVMDILGVDKLASSMAVTMSVQAVAILIGPTISGRLKDITGVYDGAYYFGGWAIILAGLVMAGGNVRKYMMDRREKQQGTRD